MLPFRKIVYPVDYSEPSNAIVPYVKDMLKRFQGTLTLVHSYGPEALAYSELAITDVDLPEEARTAEAERLRAFATENFPGEHIDTITKLGDAAMVVEDVARSQVADLVMLGTRGMGPVRRFLLGSVTTKVLHDITTPVWTGVGAALADHEPRVPYHSILCAIDYSEDAESVLWAGHALAQAYDADLSLVHVVETPVAAIEIDFAPLKKELMDAADRRLRDLKTTLGIEAQQNILDAPIAEGIRDEAVRRKADLIVVGRGQAQTTFNRLWSELYPIIRQSPCPVLSV